jgi:hypothetical protein
MMSIPMAASKLLPSPFSPTSGLVEMAHDMSHSNKAKATVTPKKAPKAIDTYLKNITISSAEAALFAASAVAFC